MEVSKSELIQKSAYCRVSGAKWYCLDVKWKFESSTCLKTSNLLSTVGRDMDLLELSAYGNVRRAPDSGGCNIQ